MGYVKVTDGAVTRFYNEDNPASRALYKELINNNTGYNTVVEPDGHPKEFTETQVKEVIQKARRSCSKLEKKTVIASNRAVLDEE